MFLRNVAYFFTLISLEYVAASDRMFGPSPGFREGRYLGRAPVSTDYPGRTRGATRPVPTEYPRRSHGAAATRPRNIRAATVRHVRRPHRALGHPPVGFVELFGPRRVLESTCAGTDRSVKTLE